jgi:hypothetical protein
MTRLGSLLCKLNAHRFSERDEFNRVWCERCGTRQPKRFETIQAPEAVGRELNRPKTRGRR